jgi:ssRNA-specific RNase YbeY (16S rRNA maturation enzyme)
MNPNISITSTLKTYPTPTSIPFETITTHYLGKTYELSLTLCGTGLMRRINRETRGKDYATNVLSFPYSHTSGEMFICLPVCKKECKEFFQRRDGQP